MRMPRSLLRSDRWIPWTFVAFFGIVVAVNAILIALALSSFSGLETEDAYRKGLAYNRVLEEADTQAALGWRIAYAVENDAGRGHRLIVDVRDRDGRAIEGAEVRAAFVRPTHEGADAERRLTPMGGGRYRADIDLMLAGQWDLFLRVDRNGLKHRSSQRLVLN